MTQKYFLSSLQDLYFDWIALIPRIDIRGYFLSSLRDENHYNKIISPLREERGPGGEAGTMKKPRLLTGVLINSGNDILSHNECSTICAGGLNDSVRNGKR